MNINRKVLGLGGSWRFATFQTAGPAGADRFNLSPGTGAAIAKQKKKKKKKKQCTMCESRGG